MSTTFIFSHEMTVVARGATSSSFRGGQFSRTFIRWLHRAYSSVGQLFRKRSQTCSFRNISENENLLVLIRSVTRGRSEANTKNVFVPVEKCVGHSLKIWAPPRKLFAPSDVPSWLRACF